MLSGPMVYRPIAKAPAVVEQLRTLFKEARDRRNVTLTEISETLRSDMGLDWPYKKLQRFASGEIINLKKSGEEIDLVTKHLIDFYNLKSIGSDEKSVLIPLTEGQKNLIDSGLIDMNSLKRAVQKELERQVISLAKSEDIVPKP